MSCTKPTPKLHFGYLKLIEFPKKGDTFHYLHCFLIPFRVFPTTPFPLTFHPKLRKLKHRFSVCLKQVFTVCKFIKISTPVQVFRCTPVLMFCCTPAQAFCCKFCGIWATAHKIADKQKQPPEVFLKIP